jgi:hypothetical protein
VKQKLEFQVEQVQGVSVGPQVSSCKDANNFVIMASSGAFNQFRCLLF